jgi:pantetheine-phosphate adenylyltransferase
MAVALYAGTFDPVTLGHVDIVRRGAELFDRVVCAVGARAEKTTIFTAEERVSLLREAVKGIRNVAVAPFQGLVVDFAREQGASVLLRGVRNTTDWEYENRMALTNRRLLEGIETVLLVASPEHAFLSSTLIKEILLAGGSVAEFVPPHVARALHERSG